MSNYCGAKLFETPDIDGTKGEKTKSKKTVTPERVVNCRQPEPKSANEAMTLNLSH